MQRIVFRVNEVFAAVLLGYSRLMSWENDCDPELVEETLESFLLCDVLQITPPATVDSGSWKYRFHQSVSDDEDSLNDDEDSLNEDQLSDDEDSLNDDQLSDDDVFLNDDEDSLNEDQLSDDEDSLNDDEDSLNDDE